MAKKKDERKAKKDAWRKRKADAKAEPTKAKHGREEVLQTVKGLNPFEMHELRKRIDRHRERNQERIREIDAYNQKLDAQAQEVKELQKRVLEEGRELTAEELPKDLEPWVEEPIPEMNLEQLVEEVKRDMRNADGSSKPLKFKDFQELPEAEQKKLFDEFLGDLSHREVKEYNRRIQEIVAAHGKDDDYELDLIAVRDEVLRDLRPQPQRREYRPHEREDPEDQSVETYLELVSNCLKYSREAATPEARAECLRNYMVLKEARVFHIGQPTYIAVHQEADRYTTTTAGFEYDEPNSGKPIPHRDNQQYVNFFLHEAKHQHFPETFPFPCIFLGYGSGLKLPEHTIDLKAPSTLRDHMEEIFLLGHVVTSDGLALSCLRGTIRNPADDRAYVLWFDEARNEGGGWTRGLDLEPWILPHLIKLINSYRTFVVETELSGQVRKGIKENKKPLGVDDYKFMPRPYYTLRLQSNVIREAIRKQLGKPPKPKLYKTDVRGHERCRIRRGPIPIDPKLAAKLEKRGYRIFTANQLDQETYERLGERGMAYKRADEWLAVKASWVKDHLSSSNPNLPYIPAVRKLGSVKTAPQKRTGAWTEDPAAR